MKQIHFYILSVISLFITSLATDDFYIEEKDNQEFWNSFKNFLNHQDDENFNTAWMKLNEVYSK